MDVTCTCVTLCLEAIHIVEGGPDPIRLDRLASLYLEAIEASAEGKSLEVLKDDLGIIILGLIHENTKLTKSLL